MWLKLTQLKVGLEFDEAKLNDFIISQFHFPAGSIKSLKIQHKSLDARHKKELFFIYTIVFEVDLTDYEIEAILGANSNLSVFQPVESGKHIKTKLSRPIRPVIVGAGPAGLFAGLKLAEAGLKPIIIERGDGLAARIENVNRFWKQGVLDPESNIQYGVGGAGTFSDGKLMTRIKDPALPEILENIVKMGGPPEILYWQYPHIGTDLLREVVTNLQKMIIDYGGEVFFRSKLTDIHIRDGKLTSIQINESTIIETDLLILAVGNCARDIFEKLLQRGIQVIAKPFAVGLRIEHPQDLINKAQYGQWANHPKLGPAEYRLTYQHQNSGRGVYTFCMCPGGTVVGATSEYDAVVTNGMSYHNRDSGVANSAIIVTVNQIDFNSSEPLAGVQFQRKLENKAFHLGGANFFAPVQKVKDFLKKEVTSTAFELKPSYLPGYTLANLWDLLPNEICEAMRDGIQYFGRQLRGFDWPEAVLTGIETRTSAPVRILRNEFRETVGFPGIFPVGEGAGYAGGIISSALDGWKTAQEIIGKLGAEN